MMNDHRVHAVIRRALGAVGGEPFSRHDADEHSILGVFVTARLREIRIAG
jgi:hypothetical protein